MLLRNDPKLLAPILEYLDQLGNSELIEVEFSTTLSCILVGLTLERLDCSQAAGRNAEDLPQQGTGRDSTVDKSL